MAGIIKTAKAVGREAGRAFGSLRAPRARKGSPSLGFALVPDQLNPRVVRKKPRKAGRTRILFTKSGKPVSVRNAPAVRRLRKRRR